MPPKRPLNQHTEERKKLQKKKKSQKQENDDAGELPGKESLYHSFNRLLHQEDLSDILNLAKLEDNGAMELEKKSENMSNTLGVLADLWKSPLVMEHFCPEHNKPNVAVCKLCHKRLTVGIGKYVMLEHHLNKSHNLQYNLYNEVYQVKPPMKTYTRLRNKGLSGGQKSEMIQENGVDVSRESLAGVWNAPLVKKYFTRIRNFASCDLCRKRFKMYSEEYVILQHHLQVKHREHYDDYQKMFMLNRTRRTYSRDRLNKKYQLNDDVAKIKEDTSFKILENQMILPEPSIHSSAQDRISLKQENSCKKYKPGVPQKTYSKETDDVTIKKPVRGRKKLGPEKLSSANSSIKINSDSSDDVQEIFPNTLPCKSPIIIKIKKEPGNCDSLVNVINSCLKMPVACPKESNPLNVNPKITSSLRTYIRPRKSLVLTENQEASSSEEINLPCCYTSTSSVETELQDLTKLNAEAIQKNCEEMLHSVNISRLPQDASVAFRLNHKHQLNDDDDEARGEGPVKLKILHCEETLPSVNISRLSQDASGVFRLCDNHESILPDPDPTQLAKPKEEPLDTYEQEDSKLNISMVFP